VVEVRKDCVLDSSRNYCPFYFSYIATRIEVIFAGRTFAAYGSVYIVASLIWLWLIKGQRPDKWDISGAIICIAGAMIILYGQRP